MALMCAYENCVCVKYPCSSTAFFRLPSDDRRSTWIRNSGNKALLNISEKAQRFFCEKHFRDCDIRTQFHRKILRRHAVPIAFESPATECSPSTAQLHNAFSETDETHDDISENNGKLEPVIYEYVEVPELKDECSSKTKKRRLTNTSDPPDLCFEKVETLYATEDELSNSYSSVIQYSEAENSEEENHLDENDISPKSVGYETERYDLDCENTINILQDKIANESEEPTQQSSNPIPQTDSDYLEDKHFALSLVGYFQRLPKSKKCLAKLKILQYLTELEIGLPGSL